MSTSALTRYVPLLGWVTGYDRKWLIADALALLFSSRAGTVEVTPR